MNNLKLEVGKWYRAKNGTKHEIIYYNLQADLYISSYGVCFNENGIHEENYEIDLIEEWKEPKTGELWLNIYRGNYAIHDSKNNANGVSTKGRLACVKVTWTEGQFDE